MGRLAVIQRGITLSIFGFIFVGAAAAWQFERWLWLWIAPALLAAGYAGALGLEFTWLRASYRPGASDCPSRRQLLLAWLSEIAAGPKTFLWRQPFRSGAFPDRLTSEHDGARGVVFVHGFFCNRGFWNPWLARLGARGIPFVAVSMEPVFGSIDDYAGAIDTAVRRLTSSTGRAPLLVAHSMGGLACRAWLARGTHGQAASHIVTIGTPHRGTWMARHSRTRNGIQMRLKSVWLEALERDERSRASTTPFTCFWSHCDNIVFPTRTATLPNADNRHLAGTPHIAMAFHPEVMAEVDRLLET